MTLSPDDREKVGRALFGIAGVFTIGNWQRIAPATAIDVWSADRSVFYATIPPRSFYVHEGDFNSDLIKSKLTELGYQKVEYGSYSYYRINDDFSPGNLSNPVSQEVLSAMNRVAVLDDMVIIAPATEIMTGILDGLADKELPLIDNPAVQALAASLGDVLSGVIMNPERTLNSNPPQQMPPFNLRVPADWGLLHQYDMAGMGYKDDGNDRFWVISLYYKDAQAASADAGELAKRMKSYIFNTNLPGDRPGAPRKPLTDYVEVGTPRVVPYPGGATLTVESRLLPGT